MSVLKINLGKALPRNATVSIEVIDSNMELVRHELISDLSPKLINLDEPGHYLVRGQLPSGEISQVQASVVAGKDATVNLTFSASPHEWLGWATYLGELPSSMLGAEPKTPNPRSVDLQTLWWRLWEKHNEWETVPKDLTYPRFDRDEKMSVAVLHLAGRPDSHRLLEIGSDTIMRRYLLLPPTNANISILVRPSRNASAHNSGIVMKVVTDNPQVEAFSHYLRSGSTNTAQRLGDELAKNAELLLKEKRVEPLTAIVGAYYLLARESFDRMHDWVRNLTSLYPTNADGPVIYAWQFMQQKDEIDPEAETWLLQAADRGLPVYTVGVRLLIDGLEFFSEGSKVARAALSRVQRYARAIDWTQRTTIYYGEAPDLPQLKAPVGKPVDDHDIYPFK